MGDMSNINSFREERRRPTQPIGKTLKRLWQYLGVRRGRIVLALFLMLLCNLCSLAGPKLSGLAIDAIHFDMLPEELRHVAVLCAVMAALYLLSSLLSYLVARLTLKISRDVAYGLRRDIFRHLLSLPVRYFDERQTGDILSVISYDVDTVTNSLSTDILSVFTSLFTLAISLLMMLSILPKLALVFLVTVPLTVLFTRWRNVRVRPLFRKRSRCLGEMNGYAEEMIGGQRTTRAYGQEEAVIAGFADVNKTASDAVFTAERSGCVIGTGMNFINNLSLTLVSLFGGLLLLAGRAKLGDISAFIQYSRKFTGPIGELGNIVGDLQSAAAAAERVFALLDEAPEAADAPEAAALADVQGDVRLQNVSFGYDPEQVVLRDLSLSAVPGSLVAIVGPTGAGKTTIINLLMRFYDIQSGAITVDGSDIYRVQRDSLRRAYTMVLQETWLFHGTVAENIAYGSDHASREDVIHAAKAAGIDGFIRRLPQGYDTVLDEGGTNVSKGQKQMLTIARAMLADSKMLILDEATSNVDTQTEKKIQRTMRELMRGRTCFVIAHRLSTIRHADTILVVQNGSVVEQGRHEDLMAQNGAYAALYKAQFEVY